MNPDNEQGDIRDDPVLGPIHRDRQRVLKRTDNRLLILLAVVTPIVVLVDKSSLKSIWTSVASVLAIVGIIAWTIVSSIRGQKKVASKHGLACPNCGHTPMPYNIMTTAITQRCARCKTKLTPVG